MIDKWIHKDIEGILNNHNRVVVTDAKEEGRFLLNFLPKDTHVITVEGSEALTEIEARYHAENDFPKDKVVFYVNRPHQDLVYLLEYAETNGCVVLDDMEAYIKGHLFEALHINTEKQKEELLMAAKLSKGKSLNWWQGVLTGIIQPLEVNQRMVDLIENPQVARQNMDDDIWKVFVTEVFRILQKPETLQDPAVLAKTVADTIFEGLLHNKLSAPLSAIYYQMTDSAALKTVWLKYIDEYALPQMANALTAHPEHCFEALDKKFFCALSKALENGEFIGDYLHALKNRVDSKKAMVFKSSWLKDLEVLLNFKVEGLSQVNTLKELAAYYQQHFAALDEAIRHLYVHWLNDEKVLRPFQYIYEQYNKELLGKWFSFVNLYQPTQQSLLKEKLRGEGRIAVIVCDGLRLEIAEAVARNLKYKHKNEVAFATLPSVTESGMSALFGCDDVELVAQNRYKILKNDVPDAEVMVLEKLNSGVTASKLVLMFGDIDQVGEKKQLAGLKDIAGYESFLVEKIADLFNMGFSKVYLTADHGFVITGILDEADKIPVPSGDLQKVEERFCLAEEPIPAQHLIERQRDFKDSKYQYYAKSDKPFVSRGVYGYAHGGFTPQECIIPMFEFEQEQQDALQINIQNKKDLSNITGAFFTVRLKAEAYKGTLFSQERKVLLQLFDQGNLLTTSAVLKLSPSAEVEVEFTLPAAGKLKLVVVDAKTQQQIDYCDVKKSSSRDLDDLF